MLSFVRSLRVKVCGHMTLSYYRELHKKKNAILWRNNKAQAAIVNFTI